MQWRKEPVALYDVMIRTYTIRVPAVFVLSFVFCFAEPCGSTVASAMRESISRIGSCQRSCWQCSAAVSALLSSSHIQQTSKINHSTHISSVASSQVCAKEQAVRTSWMDVRSDWLVWSGSYYSVARWTKEKPRGLITRSHASRHCFNRQYTNLSSDRTGVCTILKLLGLPSLDRHHHQRQACGMWSLAYTAFRGCKCDKHTCNLIRLCKTFTNDWLLRPMFGRLCSCFNWRQGWLKSHTDLQW